MMTFGGMAWLVIARTDGMGEPRIVADTSWKGWPKVKDFGGNIVPDQKMGGKDVYHVIGASEDGKTIAPGVVRPKRDPHPLVVPPEVQEIVARKAAPPEVQEIGPDGNPIGSTEEEELAEVTEPVAAPTVVKNKGGRPKKA